MTTPPTLDPLLEHKLAVFRAAPARDPHAAAQGKAAFLARAQELSAARKPSTAPAQPIKRPQSFRVPLFRRIPIAIPVLLALVAALVIGGTITASAAQESLPGQSLYLLKTLSEDVRSDLTGSLPAQASLQIEFANRRFEEALRLVETGEGLPLAFLERWQQQMDQALRNSTLLEDSRMRQALLAMQAQWTSQLQQLQTWQTNQATAGQGGLEQVQRMLETRLYWVGIGLADPATFRLHFQNNQQPLAHTPGATTQTVSPGERISPSVSGTPEPGRGTGPAPTAAQGGATNAPGPQTPAGSPGYPGTAGPAHTPQATNAPGTVGAPTPSGPNATSPGGNPNNGPGNSPGGGSGPGNDPGSGGGGPGNNPGNGSKGTP